MLIDLSLTEEQIRRLYKPKYQKDIDVFIDDDTYLVTTKDSATDKVSRLVFRKRLSQGVYLGFELIHPYDLEKMLGWKVSRWSLSTAEVLCPEDPMRFYIENQEYYGIGDSPEQIFSHLGIKRDFLDSEDEYICTLQQKLKSNGDCFRWHKNGEYIGIHKPQDEYFSKEPLIEEVWFYHFYRILSKNN